MRPGGVFISYRSDDVPLVAEAVHTELSRRIDERDIFLDHASMQPAQDYPDALRAALEQAGVLVCLIGPDWLGAGTVTRPIDRPGDWVRREVARALERGIHILPVLVDEAQPLTPDELPAPIRALARKQALRLTRHHYAQELDELTRKVLELAPVVQQRQPPARSPAQSAAQSATRPPRGTGVSPAVLPAVATLAVVTAIVLLAFILWPRKEPTGQAAATGAPTPTATSTTTTEVATSDTTTESSTTAAVADAGGWPTSAQDGSTAFYEYLGSIPLIPDWVACERTYCIVGTADDGYLFTQHPIDRKAEFRLAGDPRTKLASLGLDQARITALLSR